MASAVTVGGALDVCKQEGLQGRDAEALGILDRLFTLLPKAEKAEEIQSVVMELSGYDREKLYFAMRRACIAAGRILNLQEDPHYVEHNFANPWFPAETKQQAVVQFAFEEGLITYNYAKFDQSFNEGIKGLFSTTPPSLADRVIARLKS